MTGRNAGSSPSRRERNCPRAIASGLSSDGRPFELAPLHREPSCAGARRSAGRRRRDNGRSPAASHAPSHRGHVRGNRDLCASRAERRALAAAAGIASPGGDVASDCRLGAAAPVGYPRACACARPESSEDAAAARSREEAEASRGADTRTGAIRLEASSCRSLEASFAPTRYARKGAAGTGCESAATPAGRHYRGTASRAGRRRIQPRVLLTQLAGADQRGARTALGAGAMTKSGGAAFLSPGCRC